MKTGIIIPCYNEENRLVSKTFLDFVSSNLDFHLCFVNDGSKDNTLEVLNKIKSQCSYNVSIVDIKKNMGKASAVRAGVRYLYNRDDINYIGFIDADLSTDFRDFKDLVKTLKDNDELFVVFGSRNSKGGSIKRDKFRNLFSKTIKIFLNFILGLPIRDTQCGAKVFSRGVIPIVYGEKFMSKWLFDLEIFLRLKKQLGKQHIMKHICEQPLMRWKHVDDSKISFMDSIAIPSILMKIWTVYNLYSSFKLVKPNANEFLMEGGISKEQMSIAA